MKRFLGLISGAFALFFVVLAGVQPAIAASAGCLAINSLWGGGYLGTDTNEQWQEQLALDVGDVINYRVTTSGSMVTAERPAGGPGFAIYTDGGPPDFNYGVELETYGTIGNELNLNSRYVAATAGNYVVYAWGGSPGTVNATVPARLLSLRRPLLVWTLVRGPCPAVPPSRLPART